MLSYLFQYLFCFFPVNGVEKQQFLKAIQTILKEAKIKDALVVETLGIQIEGQFFEGGAFVYLNHFGNAKEMTRYINGLISEARIKSFEAVFTNIGNEYGDEGLKPLLKPKNIKPGV